MKIERILMLVALMLNCLGCILSIALLIVSLLERDYKKTLWAIVVLIISVEMIYDKRNLI